MFKVNSVVDTESDCDPGCVGLSASCIELAIRLYGNDMSHVIRKPDFCLCENSN